MKKLKNILQCNYIYYLFFLFSIIYSFFYIYFDNIKTIYSSETKYVYGYISNYKIDEDKLTIQLNSKEDLIINYYFKSDYEKDNFNLSYNDYIYVHGEFSIPQNNSNFNLFNYRKYLLSKKINYTVTSDEIKLIKSNSNIFYKLKRKILNRINKCNKSGNYLKAFILSDKSNIDDKIILAYQNMGISHLFAVSGMHISLVSLILLKVFKRFKENKKYIIISFILIFYLFLTNYTISMLRACMQFILFYLNKLFNLKIKNINIVIFIFNILLLYNPYYIYNTGFIFSFLISFFLIKYNSIFNKKNYIYNIFLISLISFLASIPILINNFYKVNFLSVIYNIFYVPFMSYILFPLSLLTFIFPFLDKINYIVITFFEKMSTYLSSIDILTFSVAKLPILFIIIYYIVLILLLNKIVLKKFKLKNCIGILLLLIFFINFKRITLSLTVTYIDVGQGDSILIRLFDKNILIDTSGKINYNDSNYSIANDVLINYFNSSGVKKINYLIITHGDYDHMGDAVELVNNFKVEKVIFNCYEYNDLEKELIDVLDDKNIKYYSCIKKLNINKYDLEFLNTKKYDNENDNSNVIYLNYNNYKFLFMGDASEEREKDILNKYNLNNIDFLKVSHHGSDTSSSKEFIYSINPKYSIISVGKNNRYGHPKQSVLETLSNSVIYRTDINGSIKIIVNKKGYNIETCK